MLSLRAHAIIFGSLFATLIGVAILGNVLQSMGMAPFSGSARYVALALFFGLFLAVGLSAVPLMVKLAIAAQVRAGNENAPMIASVIRNQNTIVWSMWALMLVGTAIAVPAAIASGVLDEEPPRAVGAAVTSGSADSIR